LDRHCRDIALAEATESTAPNTQTPRLSYERTPRAYDECFQDPVCAGFTKAWICRLFPSLPSTATQPDRPFNSPVLQRRRKLRRRSRTNGSRRIDRGTLEGSRSRQDHG